MRTILGCERTNTSTRLALRILVPWTALVLGAGCGEEPEQSHAATNAQAPDAAAVGSVSQAVTGDTDNDGVPDGKDPCPSDADKFGPSCVVDTTGYKLLYDLTPPTSSDWDTAAQVNAVYSYNAASTYAATAYSKIGYLITLDNSYVWATVDDFTADNEAQLGIPVDWTYDQAVSNVNVTTNVAGVAASNAAGNVEMWSNCYSVGLNGVYDYDDDITTADCHGSFQLHVGTSTIFGFNGWSASEVDALGIGNRATSHPDWTLAQNATSYTTRRIQVFILPEDTDNDGTADATDTDDDNDGVADGSDSRPYDATACRDVDTDGCDDCTNTGANSSGGNTTHDCVKRSCAAILAAVPTAPSGVYPIDPDGSLTTYSTMSAQCDMTTDGGGWTLALNYLHKGTGALNTNPALATRTTSLPIIGSSTLGTDESALTANWGHPSSAFWKALDSCELRFQGQTSNHARVMHFKTSHANTLAYFRSGTGSMTGIASSFTALTGHTTNLPASTANYFTNQNDIASTEFPFWLSSTYHWGIKGLGSRWEVDDYPNNGNFNTLHRIWYRSADTDGDGVGDCNDCAPSNAAIYPGATEIAGDGVDQNCDGVETCFDDDDNDGFLDTSADTRASSDTDCADANEGTTADLTTDCNDALATIYPGATEVTGDSVDQNCDGAEVCFDDDDDDGYLDTAADTRASSDTDCADANEGTTADLTTDCDDTNSGRNPGLSDTTGDGVDSNCDNTEVCYADADNDTYRNSTTVNSVVAAISSTGNENQTVTLTCASGVITAIGFASYGTPTGTAPNFATSSCHAVNSLNIVTTRCLGQASCSTPANNATFGDPCGGTVKRLYIAATCGNTNCSDSGEAVTGDPTGECNDASAAINPGATEACDASNVDEDCDGTADDADTAATGKTSWYVDADADTYGTGAAQLRCDAGGGYTALNNTDCNDAATAVNPAATEVCDPSNVDEDCDGLADDSDSSVTGKLSYYLDFDRDTYGMPGTPRVACEPIFTQDATRAGDCSDNNASVNPGATEACDPSNTDEDCDGNADDADTTATGKTEWYQDSDSDGYGNVSATAQRCDAGGGYIANKTDCNDSVVGINPAAAEVCDASNVDEDCDTLADDSDPSATNKTLFYQDSDSDTYGNPSSTQARCDAGGGYIANNTDCNDAASSINPAATEVCDNANTDEDCDGSADDADSAANNKVTYYLDSDGDGYGNPATSQTRCDADANYITENTDCDDAANATYPGAADACDAIDQDCDSNLVESFDNFDEDATPDCADDDDDNDGDLDVSDCNDFDDEISASASDANCDGIDNDCDEEVDQGGSPDDAACVAKDGDEDGIPNGDECPGAGNCPDTDFDGTPDYQDTDSDGDGVNDIDDETPADACTPNSDVAYCESGDADEDGIPNGLECVDPSECQDSDQDGTPDFEDEDSDDDGDTDGVECTDAEDCDEDGDGLPDYIEPSDRDSDNDGLSDQEDDDSDNDGTIDGDECSKAVCFDSDGDGLNDNVDPTNEDDEGDIDEDGISDDLECETRGRCPDSDGDGLPDYVDTDSDNDETLDEDELEGDNTNPCAPDDTVLACTDGDADEDGIDNADECPNGACPDTDGDGLADHVDTDSDNDGTLDEDDDDRTNACAPATDPVVCATGDADNDGIPNGDECSDVAECEDSDDDGTPDYQDTDSDNDGTPDLTDSAANDPCAPSSDVIECATGDADDDGIPNEDECTTPDACVDTDQDGTPDFEDSDSDNDGQTDQTECPSGTCGDADSDGLPDQLESDEVDSDGDGTPDAQDTDSDNDGTSDGAECPQGICEDSDGDGLNDNVDNSNNDDGGDTDGDGIDDNNECGVPPCADTDEDGIPDFADEDSDNDGVDDTDETGNGATDPCAPDANALSCTSGDNDGDGVPNGTDSAPDDACAPDEDDLACDTGDADGDGEPNGTDTAPSDACAPDENDLECDTGDADGDGVPNGTDTAPSDACAPDQNDLECDTGDADGDGTPNGTDPDDADPCAPSASGTGCDTGGDDAGAGNGDNNGGGNGNNNGAGNGDNNGAGNGDNNGGDTGSVDDAGVDDDADAGDAGTDSTGGDSACSAAEGRTGNASSLLWMAALGLVVVRRRRARRAA